MGNHAAAAPFGPKTLSFFRHRRHFLLQFLNNLQDPIATHDRIIDVEPELWCVLEHDRSPDQALDPFPVTGQQPNPALLLVRISQNAHEYDGGMQVARYLDIIHSDQSGLTDRELAADHLANLALEQFAHTLESKRGHSPGKMMLKR